MTTEASSPATAPTAIEADPGALTIENVERVLDELRPYLMADGGNVEIVEIDGPVVKVRLQGACGSCPSSTMTLKMGIERKLRESIPEVSEVVQVL
jgi:Fe-S cluster biogenesis protein NfuA